MREISKKLQEFAEGAEPEKLRLHGPRQPGSTREFLVFLVTHPGEEGSAF
jgi:hypothetical protein